MRSSIALIGDYNAAVTAHRAIPEAIRLACDVDETRCESSWIHTASLNGDVGNQLAGFSGIWCVPASPYANTRGAIEAIRFAREAGVPFLGTCGGFQHAMLEYAETVWKLEHAAHAETEPDARDAVIAPLECALVEQAGDLHFEPGSTLARMYGAAIATEKYHCRYGLSSRYRDRLRSGPLRVIARDSTGDVRAVELEGHPFFIATLFQPERSALGGQSHPLIRAFVAAARHQGDVS